jgi:hypothetical protein
LDSFNQREQILASSPSHIWIPPPLFLYPLFRGIRVNLGGGAKSINKQYNKRSSLVGSLKLNEDLRHATDIYIKPKLGRNINYTLSFDKYIYSLPAGGGVCS